MEETQGSKNHLVKLASIVSISSTIGLHQFYCK